MINSKCGRCSFNIMFKTWLNIGFRSFFELSTLSDPNLRSHSFGPNLFQISISFSNPTPALYHFNTQMNFSSLSFIAVSALFAFATVDAAVVNPTYMNAYNKVNSGYNKFAKLRTKFRGRSRSRRSIMV